MSGLYRPFQRLAVLGVGLLGGSVALAARRAGAARHVVGAGGRGESLARALERGTIDEMAPAADAVAGADLVVLATPVGRMPSLLAEVSSRLSEGALVTDVGSVKGILADTLPGLLPPGVSYVGAHPMAGSHRRGAQHARVDLFDGQSCALIALPGTAPGAVSRVAAFWRALGARVVARTPEEHDAEVAWTSHLPHLLAYAFGRALDKAPAGRGRLEGQSFTDFTRIARSDAGLWSDIFDGNRKALTGPLQAFTASLRELARAIEQGDADSLETLLRSAQRALLQPEDARSGGDDPEIEAAPKGSEPSQE